VPTRGEPEGEGGASYWFPDCPVPCPAPRTGVLAERRTLSAILSGICIAVGGLGVAVWVLEGAPWSVAPFLFGLLMSTALWHYVAMVVEVRITSSAFLYRRRRTFLPIPWGDISCVRIYSLRTCGISYIRVCGRSRLPLAVFPVWVPWYRTENWSELIRLADDAAKRVSAKHVW
jgi:hypothetical protein